MRNWAVAGFTQLLASRHADNIDEKGREYLGHIAKASDRMQALISDLLVYARLGHEAKEGFDQVDLNAVIADVTETLNGSIAEKQAAIDVETLPRVRGNAIQLMRVFQNLVSNALKFQRPEIAPNIRIRAEETPDHWLVSVADEGIGIPAAQHDRVFAPFERLHSDVEYSGTGLGLAICRKIVESHGGRLMVTDNAPHGVVFTVSLPKQAAA
jgi:signal transduction histidine kinase